MVRWGMFIDLKRCIGCQTCTIACKLNNHVPRGVYLGRVVDYEVGTYPNVTRRFLPISCMHCKSPPCKDACPTKATIQREDGIVYIDYDRCVGCKSCIMVCPYKARSPYEREEVYYRGKLTPYEELIAKEYTRGTVIKCDFCRKRIDDGIRRGLKPGVDPDATPICVISCITNARKFGDLDDPSSEVSKEISRRKAFQLHPEQGTDPSIYYAW